MITPLALASLAAENQFLVGCVATALAGFVFFCAGIFVGFLCFNGRARLAEELEKGNRDQSQVNHRTWRQTKLTKAKLEEVIATHG